MISHLTEKHPSQQPTHLGSFAFPHTNIKQQKQSKKHSHQQQNKNINPPHATICTAMLKEPPPQPTRS